MLIGLTGYGFGSEYDPATNVQVDWSVAWSHEDVHVLYKAVHVVIGMSNHDVVPR